MLKLEPARLVTLTVLALAYAASSACKRPSPAATKAQPARTASATASALSQVAPPSAPSSSAANVDPELTQLLERWNAATNAGDGAVLYA